MVKSLERLVNIEDTQHPMTPPHQNRIKLWRPPHLPTLELVRANYVNQRFARHYHEHYDIGVIRKGRPGVLLSQFRPRQNLPVNGNIKTEQGILLMR